jgi:ApeA N-terminal domain 1
VYNPSAFIEQQFLSLVTALEVYHRRAISTPDPPEKHDRRKREILEAAPDEHRGWLEQKLKFSHEPTLQERLHEIFRRNREVAQAIVGKKKARADFIREVVDARNYRVHFGERLEGRAAKGAELHPINQKLKQLLEACLMAEIGFGDDEIKNAVVGLR